MAKVTIEDVAKAAGVSRSLVSIAYRGVAGVSKATSEHIFAVGDRLGYVPNAHAARLASKQLKTIGVYLQDLHNEVFADIYDGIRSVVGASIPLVLAVGSPQLESDEAALETLIAARVDVIIAAGLTMSDSKLNSFAGRATIISVTRQNSHVHSISADDYQGARLATEHLVAQGHQRVGFLANPQTDGYRQRMAGYRDSINDASLGEFIRQTSYARIEAEQDAAALLDQGVTAIISHNDSTALGVLDALVSRGLVAGRDVAVVGFDNTALSQAPVLALTTVDPHSQLLGQEAAKLALAEISGETLRLAQTQIAPELVIRASSSSRFSG